MDEEILILVIGLVAVIPIVTMVQTFTIKRLAKSLLLDVESLKDRVWRLGQEIESLVPGREAGAGRATLAS